MRAPLTLAPRGDKEHLRDGEGMAKAESGVRVLRERGRAKGVTRAVSIAAACGAGECRASGALDFCAAPSILDFLPPVAHHQVSSLCRS